MQNEAAIIIQDNLIHRDNFNIDFPRLLIGNGASRAIWDGFSYNSLYEVAQTNNEYPLNEQDIALFESLNTTNFERVLYYLYIARYVNTIFEVDANSISESYENIKYALIEAVQRTHIEWQNIPSDTLTAINNCFSNYRHIYSTNYDLLTYWAVMQNPDRFRDFCWNDNRFNVNDTEIWGANVTTVLYLHGGLHLYRDFFSGETSKRVNDGQTLLESFGDRINDEEVNTLFVAEGSSEEKLSSINSSDYLSFAYERFSSDLGRLDIFGSSLDASDQHIIDAINTSPTNEIAFSINPNIDHDIQSRQLGVYNSLPHKNITFYDSTTHPLGAENFLVNE